MDHSKAFQADTQQVFTPSNVISLLRIPISLGIVYLHMNNGGRVNSGIIILIALGVISDYLDGYLARRFNQVSELGKALDPICDKIGAAILFIYVVWLGRIPVWFLGFLVSRDVIIALGSLWVRKKMGTMPMAINSGKLSLNVVVLYWAAAFIVPANAYLLDIAQGLALGVMIYSLGDYLHRFYKIAQTG